MVVSLLLDDREKASTINKNIYVYITGETVFNPELAERRAISCR